MTLSSTLRLHLDASALTANWRALDRMSGSAACGAAVKANGYGLGAAEVARRLADAGCRDFFVANWSEAAELAGFGLSVSVLHGVRAEDMGARVPGVRPVLTTADQVRRWGQAGRGPCDVMVDTGMNRLGVSVLEVEQGLLDSLRIETLMSHLACADEDHPMNERQRARFAALRGRTGAKRLSLANSAGIALGREYAFDLTRPGLALYGGVARAELEGVVREVATPQAQILQRRRVPAGEAVGYGASHVVTADTEVAILQIGYADGYLRGFSDRGQAFAGDAVLPVLGRVSMDLTAIGVDAAPGLAEGDWVSIDYALPAASAASGLSQYELLTGLGRRYQRVWE